MDLDRVARPPWYQSFILRDQGLVRGCWMSLSTEEPPSIECKRQICQTSVVYQPSNGLPAIGHSPPSGSALLQKSKLGVDVPFHLGYAIAYSDPKLWPD